MLSLRVESIGSGSPFEDATDTSRATPISVIAREPKSAVGGRQSHVRN